MPLLRRAAAALAAAALCHGGAEPEVLFGGNSDPVEPQRPVVLRDINLAVTTDLHSWLEGRLHEPHLNATLGHAVSLVERLKELGRKTKKDVFFFDNGDINDGTGLSATAQDHVTHLAPLMRLAPYDALNIGNHELYQLNSMGVTPGQACAITGLHDSGYVAAWGGRYLTSNVVWPNSDEPVGSRFRVAVGEFGTRLLVFGFLYNMPDHCDAVEVQDVATTVQRPWFRQALADHGETSDAIVVLAHMDYRDELVEVILRGIRAVVGGTKPVQFLTGHSHIRGWRQVDDFAASFEAGCKMDTVGFAAFARGPSAADGAARLDFDHTDVDGNTAALAEAVGTAEALLLESSGEAVIRAIADTRKDMHLGTQIGCADRRYQTWKPLAEADSLWSLYSKRVLPEALLEPQSGGRRQLAVIQTSALSYDIFEGPFTIDDAYKTSPFGNPWFRLQGLEGSALQEMLDHLNADPGLGMRGRVGNEAPRAGADGEEVPRFVASGPVEGSALYDLVYCDFDAWDIEGYLKNATGKALHPAIYRPGSNTSSVLVDWFRGQSCTDEEVLHV